MEALLLLKKAAVGKKPVVLLKGEEETDSIKDATLARFGDTPQQYPLDETTTFYNEDTPQKLRAVVFCWLHEKSSIVDYKNACLENDVPDFKFLVKTELNTWLSGSSDSCQFIKGDVTDETTESRATSSGAGAEVTENGSNKRKLASLQEEDPLLVRLAQYEEDSINHNAALRGSKNIVFKNLISDARRFSSQLKRSKPSSKSLNHHAAAGPAAKKQPIIIVSPATTALLSLCNIKEFLENGRFVDPNSANLKRPESGVVTIHHPSDNLIPTAQNIMVVDNVDMFTKPEYWDRVVAIFTTGQAWQFTKYKYSKPEVLFSKYPGFFVSYQSDVVPKQISDWNVNVIKVDRGEKRFRDKMIVRDLWIQLEKILMARDYKK